MSVHSRDYKYYPYKVMYASNYLRIFNIYVTVWILSCLVSSRGDLRDLPGFKMFESCIEPPSKCPNPNITFHLYTR